MSLQHKIEADLGINIPIADFLKGESLSEIAGKGLALLEVDQPVTFFAERAPLREFPLSYNQRTMWFLYCLAPDSAANHIAFAVRIRSPLDVPALRAAFQMLADRHPTLRTTYKVRDGQPYQHVGDESVIVFQEVEAGDWHKSELDKLLGAEAHKPFDLKRGAFRAMLLKCGDGEHILQLTFHHIGCDFWSILSM